MGQTLTHGIYLPDEGERNCYNGLAGNWQLLDGAVGTVAEHTTQIAGKAPLVHTHTKADITDLFNSANTWSEYNTFTKTINSSHSIALSSQYDNVQLGAIPSTDQALSRFQCNDKDNDSLCYFRQFYQSSGTNTFQIFVRNKFANGTLSTSGTYDYTYLGIGIESDKSSFAQVKGKFIPYSTNTYDLGSSSYQWNNLYAQSYYYNGVAWGLDKANVWTDTNTFSSTLKQVNSTVTKGTNPQSDTIAFNAYWGGSGVSNLTNALFTRRGIVYADGSTAYIMYALENVSGGTHTSLSIKYDPNDTINSRYALMRGDFRPYYDNSFNLGISTHKWKSFNGVNPGALSLPVRGYTDSISLDTTNWDYAGNGFSISMTDNNGNYIPGWVVIVAEDVGDAFDYIKVRTTSYTRSPGLDFTTFYTGSQYNIKVCFPTAGLGYLVLKLTNGASCIKYARYYPCLGNV